MVPSVMLSPMVGTATARLSPTGRVADTNGLSADDDDAHGRRCRAGASAAIAGCAWTSRWSPKAGPRATGAAAKNGPRRPRCRTAAAAAAPKGRR
jgi:hypothetical protein